MDFVGFDWIVLFCLVLKVVGLQFNFKRLTSAMTLGGDGDRRSGHDEPNAMDVASCQ